VFFIALLTSTMILSVYANNIQVNNVTVTRQNVAEDYSYVKFDLSWDNSWRTSSVPNNWDAAWVFVKYKPTDGEWNHAYLNTIAGNHTISAGYTCSVGTTDGKGMGVFIYRDSDGTGTANLSNTQLRWEYGANGLADDSNVTVRVFAIEMVYVPEGAFYVGDGSSYGTLRQTGSNIPQQITTSPVVIKCENTGSDDTQLEGDGILVDGDGGIDMDGATEVDNPDFPTGYNAFYCMKYEISQGQYADFLNTLTSTQAANRYPNMNGSYRHTISGSYPNYTASRPERACNYLSWADGAAYSDWAGLRPMTELEFEKACRGTVEPVAGEYAWGTETIVADTSLAISGTEDGTETITTDVSNGAACYGNNAHNGGDGGYGPLRCGIFATGSSTRIESGASYYGIMEMSGNLWERSVTVGNSAGRSFTGLHGDGSLDGSGNADAVDWPGTNAQGAGFRGGGWDYFAGSLHVSGRYYAASTGSSRYEYVGFRSVRVSP